MEVTKKSKAVEVYANIINRISKDHVKTDIRIFDDDKNECVITMVTVKDDSYLRNEVIPVLKRTGYVPAEFPYDIPNVGDMIARSYAGKTIFAGNNKVILVEPTSQPNTGFLRLMSFLCASAPFDNSSAKKTSSTFGSF